MVFLKVFKGEIALQGNSKHASHLYRLMFQCEELLTKGTLSVKSPHRDLLLSVRQGAVSYDQLMEFAESKELELQELYKNCKLLPKEPAYGKLDQLCASLVEKFHMGFL